MTTTLDNAEHQDEFFRSIQLVDSSEMSEMRGGTKPLKVRKRAQPVRVVVGGPARRHRSTITLPRSPHSARSSKSFRPAYTLSSPTSSQTLIRQLHSRSQSIKTISTQSQSHRTPSLSSTHSRAHQSISRLFMSLVENSDSPISPLVMSPPIPLTKSKTRQSRSSSGQSELHLGLGKFTIYDESAKPLPSPPSSPLLSPRHLQKLLPPSPFTPTPMTPSRAPRKAAALLGTGAAYSAPVHRGKKRKEHFRPLPSSTLLEIERFFGETPRRQKKVPSGVKLNANVKAQARAHSGRDKTRDDVGTGRRLGHVGEDGSMWLDVEEEQEFAWLMTDLVYPEYASKESKVHKAENHLVDKDGKSVHKVQDGTNLEVLYETSDEEGWGMKAFTSVLSIPKTSKKGDNPTNLSSNITSITARRTPRPENTPHPWNAPLPSILLASTQHARAAATSRMNVGRLSPRSNSPESDTNSGVISAGESVGGSGSGSGSGSERRKGKPRPPPLNLKPSKRNPKLPHISRTPISSDKTHHNRTPGVQLRDDDQHHHLAQINTHHLRDLDKSGVGHRDNIAVPDSATLPKRITSLPKLTSHRSISEKDIPGTPFVHPRKAPKPKDAIPPVPLIRLFSGKEVVVPKSQNTIQVAAERRDTDSKAGKRSRAEGKNLNPEYGIKTQGEMRGLDFGFDIKRQKDLEVSDKLGLGSRRTDAGRVKATSIGIGMQGMRNDRYVVRKGTEERGKENGISFFDPVTPTTKKGWFRKVQDAVRTK
ncbi:hypothetical protein M231_02800 [Tremella mesenterica]|uniref:Uncharacterized protein n=1 Tax=Tremella mesenterica TaxID=5217 RepID=A0A4Q1BPM1_TREME|nr:hypothetical protein M231_02800 [Tremella mesenterica]